MTEPAYGWGLERQESGRKPYLLNLMFWSRKEALQWLLDNMGSEPNRRAALMRRRRSGFRPVRVVLRPFGNLEAASHE